MTPATETLRPAFDTLFGARWSVALVEPPEVAPAVEPFHSPDAPPPLWAPPWPFLCLRAYLIQHAGCATQFVDARLSGGDGEWTSSLREGSGPCAVVVRAAGPWLESVAATLKAVRRAVPAAVTVVCGDAVTNFPAAVRNLPAMDYAIRGDPEPVLRALLYRLEHGRPFESLPGLWRAGQPEPAPARNADLDSLFLWEPEGIAWSAYRRDEGRRAAMRLTRGAESHESSPAACRAASLDQAAAVLEQFGPLGIAEVQLDDPPGFWTLPRLERWCAKLQARNNGQAWSLRLFPYPLPASVRENLAASGCVRIEFECPAAGRDALARHDFHLSLPEFRETIRPLNALGIACHFRFEFESPESVLESVPGLDRQLLALDGPSFTLAVAEPGPPPGSAGARDFAAALVLAGQGLCKSPRRWWRDARRGARHAARRRIDRLLVVLARGTRLYADPPLVENAPARLPSPPVERRGFAGGLLLFCVLYGVAFPLWFGQWAWLTWSQSRGGWYADGTIKFMALLEYGWIAFITLAGMRAAWWVWRGYPGGRSRARSYIALRAAGFAACYALLRLLFRHRAAPETWIILQAAWTGQLAREGLLFILWGLYLWRSARVRATYGGLVCRARVRSPDDGTFDPGSCASTIE